MLLAQMLGLVHRITHSGEAQFGEPSRPHAQASAFDAHHDAADCVLFDHLCLADAAHTARPWTLPRAQLVDTAAQPVPAAVLAPCRAYLARGPPSAA